MIILSKKNIELMPDLDAGNFGFEFQPKL